ncbi:MAG: hypothetical protein PUH24_09885 [Prevotellaceae bacterium]|nr:hypothetical protein [Prevotella sp.]MDD7258557.1 hypothetical protein [Prevotellaceae bacterium]MDY6131497.1 hypothetical protein [Prevotella sp.]
MTTVCRAQTDLRYHLAKYDTRRICDNGTILFVDIENAIRYAGVRFPAMAGNLLRNDSVSHGGHNLLRFSFLSERIDGEHLHYQGNKTLDTNALSGGQMNIKGVGTLYGKMEYGKRKTGNVYLNYNVRPEDYIPYLVSDTLGSGSVKDERYIIEGGLGVKRGCMRYGIGGEYEGIASAREAMPRKSVFSYWFRLALSVAKVTDKWLFAAKAYPEINRQDISVSSTLSACKFFHFYGLGQWNMKESGSGYAYKRQAKIMGGGTDLLMRLLPQKPLGWEWAFGFSYNYRRMQTEETSFKNLYASDTHRFSHLVLVSKALCPELFLHILLSGEGNIRKGEESIYENRKVDEQQYLYDYVLVGKNNLYERTCFMESLLMKISWLAFPRHSFSLSGGIAMKGYEEIYIMPKQEIENQSILPQLGFGYKMDFPKDNVDWHISLCVKKGIGNKYDVSKQATFSQLPQAYIPFLIRGEDAQILSSSLIYAHAIKKKGKIGFKADCRFLKRTNLPALSLYDDAYEKRRRNLDFGLSLFYLF